MAGPIFRTVLGSLRTRVLLLVVLIFAVLSVPGWFLFHRAIDAVTATLGVMIAERQVQYDRYRGLETLNGELGLAESLSSAPSIIAWLQNESDPDLKARGLADMEHYRRSFTDQSVFIVVDASGNYYFNDAQDSYGEDPYSYTLRSDLERDSWYFATRARREGCFPNVNVDDVLRVTNVWINCLITQDGQVLGMAGAGIDLSEFIRDVVDVSEPGITSMFVDQSGAIQAHRDASLVDFRSITKDIAQKITVFSLLEDPADMALLRTLMNEAAATGSSVQTAILTLGGQRVLVGVGYLDTIGWYNITTMDVDAIIDPALFLPLGALAIAMLFAAALALTWIFQVAVINRVERIEGGLGAMREGRRVDIEPDPSRDEIGRLSRALFDMSKRIAEGRLTLESQVRERTEQLESLVNHDAMTGIANRRGFESAFARFRRRAEDEDVQNGLLLIDIDNFKIINDSEGHAAGDLVVIELARRLRGAVRPSDVCGRWGGDEFVVLIRNCDAAGLQQVGAALRDMMRKMPVQMGDGRKLTVSISVGAALIDFEDTLEMATDMADAALYTAKEEGRDRVVMFDPDGTLRSGHPDPGLQQTA